MRIVFHCYFSAGRAQALITFKSEQSVPKQSFVQQESTDTPGVLMLLFNEGKMPAREVSQIAMELPSCDGTLCKMPYGDFWRNDCSSLRHELARTCILSRSGLISLLLWIIKYARLKSRHRAIGPNSKTAADITDSTHIPSLGIPMAFQSPTWPSEYHLPRTSGMSTFPAEKTLSLLCLW